jgi:hypothetical protein
VAKTQTDGWTFQQFLDTVQKLAKPGGSKPVWGIVLDGQKGYFRFSGAVTRGNGVPPFANSMPMFGNTFDFHGPEVLEVLQLGVDLLHKYKVAPADGLGLNVDQTTQMLIEGQTALAMDDFDAHGAVEKYNKSIDEGKIKGQKVNTKVVLLPLPYNPPHQMATDNRIAAAAVFRQNPDKGEAHTKNAIAFTRYVTSTEGQVRIFGEEGLVPSRQSAIDKLPKLMEDEAIRFKINYNKVAAPAPPNHPTFPQIWSTAVGPGAQAAFAAQKSPLEAMRGWVAAADAIMKDWVSANPDLAKKYEETPADYPGPRFPNWKGPQAV